jgi:hypothetical protein
MQNDLITGSFISFDHGVVHLLWMNVFDYSRMARGSFSWSPTWVLTVLQWPHSGHTSTRMKSFSPAFTSPRGIPSNIFILPYASQQYRLVSSTATNDSIWTIHSIIPCLWLDQEVRNSVLLSLWRVPGSPSMSGGCPLESHERLDSSSTQTDSSAGAVDRKPCEPY